MDNDGYVDASENGTSTTFTVIATSADGTITHTSIVNPPFEAISVIPEFPIDAIAAVVTSIGALAAYVKFRR